MGYILPIGCELCSMSILSDLSCHCVKLFWERVFWSLTLTNSVVQKKHSFPFIGLNLSYGLTQIGKYPEVQPCHACVLKAELEYLMNIIKNFHMYWKYGNLGSDLDLNLDGHLFFKLVHVFNLSELQFAC